MTPFALIFALPVAGEKPSGRALLGVAIAFAGIAIALVDPSHPAPPAAALLVSGGAASQGLGTALLRRLGPVPPMRLLAWLSLFAVPQLALASLLLEHGQAAALRHAPAAAWLSLGYAVVVGAIAAFGLWFWLVARLPLARIAPWALLQTVFGIAAGIVLLHEPPAPALIAGSLVCMAGVLLTQLSPSPSVASPLHGSRRDD
ncbi:MAG: DMT family transporter [Gluconacetobacter diazotrophicus]|nr:DMT family transporter [Gluconacetobacter diazotrophicus]